MSNMNVTVVGGGVAGLTLAYLLAKKGLEVTVLEREDRVGGLARSFRYDGWSIDIGPHRFHTNDNVVQDFIHTIMQDRLIEIPRNSKVFFCNEHFDWPLNLNAIFKLPPSLMMNAFFDLLRRPSINDDSYESYVQNRYGKTLTKHFFSEYTQKFLKTDLKDCHRDWAETGINRATIDKDIKSSSLLDLVLGVLSQKKVNTKFLYPKDGPIDEFSEILKQDIISMGGAVETDVVLTKAVVEKSCVQRLIGSDGRDWDTDFVFWTGDLHDFERILGLSPSQLNYCSTVICNLLVEGAPPVPSQWEYFGSSNFIFSRTSINTFFNPRLAPEGYYGICAELVCYENDYVWNQPETLFNSIMQGLIHVKLVRNFNSIMEVHFERIKNTYPIYKINYLMNLEEYKQKISGISNVLACGRTGGFWYNNMDHSIRSSIDIANMINPHNFAETRLLPVKGVYRGDF
jgi:protoporphyrinogen oxidase